MSILILDSTLREGEQTPGVNFSVEEKICIAKMLDELGVDIIEVGHPMVSKKVYEAVKCISNLKLKAATLAHARPFKQDIDMAKECGAEWVGIFLASSDVHLKDKLRMSKEEAKNMVMDSIRYAKQQGLKVRYSPEDASRTEECYLLDMCKSAEVAGADRISVIDTVGCMTPDKFGALVTKVKETVDVPLNVHCHNDFGLALANTMAGVNAGATLVDCCVNGLGERAGITDLVEFTSVMSLLDKRRTVDTQLLSKLSRYVEKASGLYVGSNKPLIGENVFSHKSGIHTDGVLKNPDTYESVSPELFNRQRKIIVDRYTGKRAVAQKLEEYNIEVSNEELLKIVMAIKDFGDENKIVHDTDILEIAENITGKRVLSIPQGIHGLVQVRLEPQVYTTSVVRRLTSIPGMGKLLELAGEYEISAYMRADTVAELNNRIEQVRDIPGVQSTNSRIVLKQYENGNHN